MTHGYWLNLYFHSTAIVMLGEPKRWESYLQVLVDLLKTDGKPDTAPECVPERHLPIIACNMDLQFMDRACMPRYGHGAFLVCLEALYKVGANHYNDVIMGTMASQITSLTSVQSTAYSGADQRKHKKNSASLAFVWGIHRWPVNSPH